MLFWLWKKNGKFFNESKIGQQPVVNKLKLFKFNDSEVALWYCAVDETIRLTYLTTNLFN